MSNDKWTPQPHYRNDVLMGNWFEERSKYQRNRYIHDSTYRTNYFPRPLSFPDLNQRLKYWVRSSGLEKEHLLGHHGKAHLHNLISWYDQDYNNRERTGRNVLPKLRQWDSGTLSWRPEKSDFPIVGEGTKWGLIEQKQKKWHADSSNLLHTDFNTTYTSSYQQPDQESLVASRHAPYLEFSCRTHPLNTQQNRVTVCPPNNGSLDTVAV